MAVLAALEAGHPGKAVRWMTEADTALGWAAYWGQYSMCLALGYHQLGMHELELEPARRTARDAPANIFLQMPEVRALAELGSPELESRLEEILARALKEAETARADLVERARSDAEGIVRKTREQMQHEKNQAIAELREQVADIAVEAAGTWAAEQAEADGAEAVRG